MISKAYFNLLSTTVLLSVVLLSACIPVWHTAIFSKIVNRALSKKIQVFL